MAEVALSSLPEGSYVSFSGVSGMSAVIAKHNYQSTGYTAIVGTGNSGTVPFRSQSDNNEYSGGTLDNYFNNTILNNLANFKSQISTVGYPYTPGNGSKTLSTIYRQIVTPSATEMGASSNPNSWNAEGTAFSGTVLSLLSTGNYWTRTPHLYYTSPYYAVYKTSGGGFTNEAPTTNYNSRFLLCLPSNIRVENSGAPYYVILPNRAPVITYTGASDLGDKTDGFTLNYSVSDPDGTNPSVTERLNGTVKRTYSAVSGATQDFQAVLPENFLTVLPGANTILINATDGSLSATPKTITFTKAVYNCSVTLTTPLAADDMPTAARLSITGDIPGDAEWTAEICNNGNDAAPTWENIKPAIQSGYNYVFSNTTKTAANWGVNFRVSFSRGPSNTGGYIYSIEGGFR